MIALTIFWVAATEADRESLEAARCLDDVQVLRTDPASLAKNTFAAVARGAVLFIARTDREAGQALRCGVDEILRSGEVTKSSLASAIDRARTRAEARSSPEYRHALLDQDEEAALATLGAALGEHLEAPLAMAALDCAAIAQALNCLFDVDDQFVAWTALVAPPEQLRSLVARRLSAPTSPELRSVLKRLRTSIGRAESLARRFREFAHRGEPNDRVTVGPLLEEMVEVMGQVIAPWATILLRAEPDCVAAISRTTLLIVVGVLLSSAADSIRATDRGKGTIEIRAYQEEGAVILEVQDDGREIPNDLRPGLIQFGNPSAPRTGLPGLRDRLRRVAGDLLVDSDPDGTTIRVFLPSAGAHDTMSANLAAEELHEATKVRS